MKLLFYSKIASTMRWRKYMVRHILTSGNANKHVRLALGVNCTTRDAVKVTFTGVLSMFPCYIGLVSPSLTR